MIPRSPLNNVDMGHVVILHVGPLNIDWWGKGRDIVTLLVWGPCGTIVKIVTLILGLRYTILCTENANRPNDFFPRLSEEVRKKIV